MKIKLTSRKGFTLTEAVLSVCVLAIIWLAAVDAIIVGQYSATYARHKKQAIYVAQLEIERLRKRLFTEILSSNNPVSIDTKGTPGTADDFRGSQIVTASGDLGYYKSVLVKMQWNEVFFGVNRTMYEYVGTYIANEDQLN